MKPFLRPLLPAAALAAAVAHAQTWTNSVITPVPALQGESGTFTVSSNAAEIAARNTELGPGADAILFRHAPMGTTGSISALVQVSNASPGRLANAGLMIRATNTPDAAYASLFLVSAALPSQIAAWSLAWRPADGADWQLTNWTLATPPLWLRLDRSNNTVAALTSPDGTNWSPRGVMNVALPETALAGIFAAGDEPVYGQTASFSAVAGYGLMDGNIPPSVAWNAPTDGAVILSPASVWLRASAADTDGTVAKVEFFVGTNKLGEDSLAPYAVEWTNAGFGAHVLTARATDNSGAASNTAPVLVTVVGGDADGDGMDDAWEYEWLGGTNQPAGGDYDGDGASNLAEFQAGTLPNDFFNGQAPLVSIVSGDRQTTNTGAFAADALVVAVRDTAGNALSNAPVTFSISPAGGLFATNKASGTQAAPRTVRTGGDGQASVFLKMPSTGGLQTIYAEAVDANTATQALGQAVIFEAFAQSSANKPTVTVASSDPDASEPGYNSGTFTFTRSGNLFGPLSITFSVGGTASNGGDYRAISSPVTIPAGESSTNLQITVVNDSTVESNETASVTITASSAYNVGSPGAATITISDDDKTGAVGIDGGEEHSIALMYDGTVWTWGSDSQGQLGNGSGAGSTNRPTQVPGISLVRSVAAGSFHCLAVRHDGRLRAWGEGAQGRLGNGDDEDKQSPVSVNIITNAAAVSAGEDHSMCVTTNGRLYTWGGNERGQLAKGDSGASTWTNQPRLITFSAVGTLRVAAGRRNSHIIAETVTTPNPRSAGDNSMRQVKNDTTAIYDALTSWSGSGTMIEIAAGYQFAAALRSDGRVLTWGENSDRQLGRVTPDNAPDGNPTVVAGISNVIAIAAGNDHMLALKSDGTVWAWGRREYGAVGDGTTGGDVETPRQASAPGFSNAIAIAAGAHHSLAIDGAGFVWAWGSGGGGRLGLGDNDNRLIPTRITGFNVFSYPPTAAITSPAAGAAATDAAGTLWLAATASDPDGYVAKVEFFSGANKIGEDISSPYTLQWTNAPLGTAILTAVATDNRGVATVSTPVSVTVYSGGDADGDGLSDFAELTLSPPSDFQNPDTNGDGLLDGAAWAAGLHPASGDPDGDGLSLSQEAAKGTSPFRADTDGDGVNDALDGFPLDPSRSSPPGFVPGDITPPVISLQTPANAEPLP